MKSKCSLRIAVGLLFFALIGVAPATSAVGATAQPATRDDTRAAREALDRIIRAYETGDLPTLRGALDASMIGYERFLDGAQNDFNALKQIRIHLFEAQVTAGPDVAAIQTVWEKRFFTVADSRPGLLSGRTLILMHRSANGWKLAAIAGDNLFSSQSGSLAQLNVIAPGFTRTLLAPCTLPCNIPMQIELIDPDLAGAAGATLEVRTSQGDIETVALTPVSPGRFVRSSLTFQSSPNPAPYSGAVNINISAPPVGVTFRYVDRDPGAGRPPSTLVRTIAITP